VSVEQVARACIMALLNDVGEVEKLVTADAKASGGMLPEALPIIEASKMGDMLRVGIPDIKFDIQQVMVNGNQATVNVLISGTHSGPLSMPGMPTIPPTGKTVSVKDTYVVTVQGDKASHVHVDSPAGGGMPGLIAQLGIDMSDM
jgi:hypothetical protein